jgi:hypothetical protein
MRNVACVLEGGENAYKIFAGKLEGKRLLWIPSHRWVDIIKMSLLGIRLRIQPSGKLLITFRFHKTQEIPLPS